MKPLEKGIGKIIKDLRLEFNLTQEQLANKVGKHRSYIAKIESDKDDNLRVKTLRDIIHKGFNGELKIEVTGNKRQVELKKEIPHLVKYMGSKRELIEVIFNEIHKNYEDEVVCDLFAGTSTLSGGIGHSVEMISNDIQQYSSVFSKTYLGDYGGELSLGLIDDILFKASKYVASIKERFSDYTFSYSSELTLEDFQNIELSQQDLIKTDFSSFEYHLFIKNYSGTYWSYEQCLWIDSLRKVADDYKDQTVYYPILSSLMFAMAYTAQSTGHYAQYRDANNDSSMMDILIYRRKELFPLFAKKMRELVSFLGQNKLKHKVLSLDYAKCLEEIPEKSLVYADPPYTFVHYSRFYHALETLVRYDYPEVKFKGRYRDDRHQSPFCKKTEVEQAFEKLFLGVYRKKSKLILSYSNTGMISLEHIVKIMNKVFNSEYSITSNAIQYNHSTMGRSEDKQRKVKEYLITAIPER